jgi:DNA polymerase-3 subunit beta
MNVTINNKTLVDKLTRASKFTLTRLSSVPSLHGGRISLKNNKLEITTTNLNDFYHTTIPLESKEEFSIVVDIKKIIEFLNLLPAGDIEFEIEKTSLIIKKDKTNGTFELIAGADFPTLPNVTGKEFDFKKNFLTKNLPLVLFSVSRDESRPILTGVNFLTRENTQYVVSTDGFRLSLIQEKAEQELPAVTISAQILSEIMSFGKETKLTISEEEKTASFQTEDDIIVTRLIEGEFPPFERVIPQNNKTSIVLDTDELSRNIKLASVFARDFSSIVVLDVKKDGLYIRPKIKNEKGTVVYQEGMVVGEEQKIAFNYKFILDFLSAIKSKKIIFEMNAPNAPGVFRTEDNKSYIHIIMPIRAD